MSRKLKVTITTPPGQTLADEQFVSIALKEEDDEFERAILIPSDKVIRSLPFQGEIILAEEWILPLTEALMEHVRSRGA